MGVVATKTVEIHSVDELARQRLKYHEQTLANMDVHNW